MMSRTSPLGPYETPAHDLVSTTDAEKGVFGPGHGCVFNDGDDYYAISSTMQFSPGMTILHSSDLVNWEIAGHAVNDLSEISNALTWKEMDRYGRGIWAGTLRYHNGRFYVFFGTPDEGYFMTSAKQAEGPWEPLTARTLLNSDSINYHGDTIGETASASTVLMTSQKTDL